MLITPELGRQRQETFWDLLVNQSGRARELHANERPYSKEVDGVPKGNTQCCPLVSACQVVHTFIPTHTKHPPSTL